MNGCIFSPEAPRAFTPLPDGVGFESRLLALPCFRRWRGQIECSLHSSSRSRVVIDPRGVLREFGLEVPAEVEVRVWDSTAEVRYLVRPERPAGTEHLSADDLAALVTRDAMVGVGVVAAGAPGA